MIIPRYDKIRYDFMMYRNDGIDSSTAIERLKDKWSLSEKRLLEIIGEE